MCPVFRIPVPLMYFKCIANVLKWEVSDEGGVCVTFLRGAIRRSGGESGVDGSVAGRLNRLRQQMNA